MSRLWSILLILVLAAANVWGSDNEYWLLDLNGPVGPASADHLLRNFERASAENAAGVVLKIDTPGGLDGAMRDIIHGILESPVPIIGYVAPQGSRAASAGTYILYACHVAAMAPATHLGAATPVQLGGGSGLPMPARDEGPREDKDESAAEGDTESPASTPDKNAKPGDPMQNKMINDARAYIRGLAELRGRNSEWAESAVTEASTLTASQALEMGVIDIIATDTDDLMAQVSGRTVEVAGSPLTLNGERVTLKTVEPDWRTRFLSVITNPSVAYILLMVGIYGLILEFSNPGIGAGGIIGGICLFIALYALQLLPISYAALGLLLLGLGLMVAEALSPSFGILGLGGVTAFIVGSVMLMDTDIPGFQIALPLILSLAAVTAGLLVLVLGMLMKTRRRAPVTGTATLIGRTATVTALHDDHATVRIDGELWRAHAPAPLAIGNAVVISAVHGLDLEVVKAGSEEAKTLLNNED